MTEHAAPQKPKIETFKDLCSAVYVLRISNGLTGADLAVKAGVSPATISNFERGKTCPRSPGFERIMVALGIDLEVAIKIAAQYHADMAVERYALERMVPDAPLKVRFKEVRDGSSED